LDWGRVSQRYWNESTDFPGKTLKASGIVKPSHLGDFLRLQISCLAEGVETLQFLARFDHQQEYLPGKPTVELLALYEIAQTPVIEISFLVTDQIDKALPLFEKVLSGKEIAQALGVAWVQLKQGLRLAPVFIPKPWGQEVWYTGIEQRGVSCVKSDEGKSPLDWIIAAAPEHILGPHQTPVLLKILDPLPDEVYGDLYFEMHEEKQEVYVVTHVDKTAWPNGTGGIRFGFNPELRKNFSSDNEFKLAYLAAVKDYRKVRQCIDVLLDKKRAEENIGLNDPVMPDKIRLWQQRLPHDLLASEKQKRDHMENFIAIKPLVVGDVVKVPCFTPHSLQHGVRTVEFQTPVYERKILSFAQKVLTQHHWDTESALPDLALELPTEMPLIVLEETKQLRREQVVQFKDFSVERITLQASAQWHSTLTTYGLMMCVSGCIELNGALLAAEQAVLMPAGLRVDVCTEHEGAILLWAIPV